MATATRQSLLRETPAGAAYEVQISGELTKEDYEAFVEEFEPLVERHGEVNLLLVIRDFQGWKPGAFWDEIKYNIKFFNNVGRLAVVGGSKRQALGTKFFEPFTRAKVRYFDESDELAARTWVEEF